MARTLTVKEIEDTINDMELGEEVFINGLFLNDKSANYLSKLIADGILTPTDRSLNMIVKNAQYEYLTGKKLLPQADYIKIGEL